AAVWPVPADDYSAEIAERSFQTTLKQFELADQVGFDWVTLAEHHFAPMSLNPNPMVMAGALTQVVKRAKIALLGPNIPINNPIRVAEEFAMLDTLTGGRIVAGMMRGTGNEYVTYNVNPAESRERFAEAVELIRMAWTQPRPFGWQGKYYQYRSICLWPRPVQQPYPQMFMSGSSPESGSYAAQNRMGLGFAFTTVPLSIPAVAHYKSEAREAGWEPTNQDILYRLGVHVAETDEEAIADVTPKPGTGPRVGYSVANKNVESAVAGSGYYGRDKEDQRGRLQPVQSTIQERVEKGQLLVGSPETVVKQIKKIHDDLGAGILDLTLVAQLGDKTMRCIELLGEKVLPKIREF
ncbi:MAG: LLM class flavin-dependent oxidoreductase, partial [Proteobacteria bacterium]|nr:LLM class flavin-dependent oxidoreductase [Pseudomonadota bacterium]